MVAYVVPRVLEGHLARRDFEEVEDSAHPGLERDFEDSVQQEDSVDFVHLDVLWELGLVTFAIIFI